MRKLIILLASLIVFSPVAFAGAGMWPLSNLPTATLQKKFNFTPSPAWVKHVQLASVRLAGGCSGSFVSPHGLVLTNHHCVVECLEGLSNENRDLMSHYYYADKRGKELKCPAMDIQQLVKRTNVTATVNKATAGHSGGAYQKARRAAESTLEQHCANGQPQKWNCEVVSLYHGGQYWLYKYRSYQDVRLVFVPSQQTSFFGGYPDNFNYPRYDYAVAILRVYVNGKPAHTPDYFRFSAKGPKAGELVFTSGNPGSTERNDTVAQLEYLRYPGFPDALQALGHEQGLLEAFGAQSAENARISQGALFYTNNDIKSLDGQLQALNNKAQFARKKKAESRLRARVKADPKLEKKYGNAWANIAKAQHTFMTMAKPVSMIVDGQGFDARLYQMAFTLVLGSYERTLPEAQRIGRFRNANLPGVEQQLFSTSPVYPHYDQLRLASSLTMLRNTLGPDAPIAEKLFASRSPKQAAAHAVQGTKLAAVSVRKTLWQGGEKAVRASNDPMIAMARDVLPFYLKYRKAYEDQVEAVVDANTAKIAQARFALYGTSIYPDATFTERLSYGVVKGWPRHGKEVPPFTDMAGLYKHAKGYPPLQLSKPWLEAKSKLDGKTPMNFVTTNDIVGGNSGSPVINRDGRLVGLIFDGNPPSLGGAFWYNGKLNRAVAVDSAAILVGLDKVYGAHALVRELTEH